MALNRGEGDLKQKKTRKQKKKTRPRVCSDGERISCATMLGDAWQPTRQRHARLLPVNEKRRDLSHLTADLKEHHEIIETDLSLQRKVASSHELCSGRGVADARGDPPKECEEVRCFLLGRADAAPLTLNFWSKQSGFQAFDYSAAFLT